MRLPGFTAGAALHRVEGCYLGRIGGFARSVVLPTYLVGRLPVVLPPFPPVHLDACDIAYYDCIYNKNTSQCYWFDAFCAGDNGGGGPPPGKAPK